MQIKTKETTATVLRSIGPIAAYAAQTGSGFTYDVRKSTPKQIQ